MQINPADGGDTVQFADNSLNATSWLWDFDDPASVNNSSTISNPVHAFSSNGIFNVSLVVSNQFGCSDSITIPHSVSVGIDELDDLGLRIYPIPNEGLFWFETEEQLSNNSRFELVDGLGRMVLTEQIGGSISRVEVDASNLDSGVYQLSIISEQFKATRPVIIGSLQSE